MNKTGQVTERRRFVHECGHCSRFSSEVDMSHFGAQVFLVSLQVKIISILRFITVLNKEG